MKFHFFHKWKASRDGEARTCQKCGKREVKEYLEGFPQQNSIEYVWGVNADKALATMMSEFEADIKEYDEIIIKMYTRLQNIKLSYKAIKQYYTQLEQRKQVEQ